MKTALNNAYLVEQHNYREIPTISPVTSTRQSRQSQQRLTLFQKWAYGMLVFTFAFVCLQALRCGIASGIKLEGLLHQKASVEIAHQKAVERNTHLLDNISRYSSSMGIEEMARERLDMVGEDEILVRLYPQSVAQR